MFSRAWVSAKLIAGAADADEDLALAGLGDRRVLDQLEHLRAAERGDRDGAHREPHATVPRLMSLTVVGSIAFDAVETQTGSRDRLLGGSAVHFSLASSFFDDTRVVGPVGDDFGDAEYEALHSRGVITDDIEHVPGGKTFFWAGRYERDVNIRHTLQTDLNVFEHFQPSLSEASAAADVVFLANIQPDLQREVREQCTSARFVALDSMNLWIDIAHESLIRTIQGVDGVILNDGELRQLTDEPNLVRAARAVLDLGPTRRRRQAGRVRLGAVHARGLLRAAGLPDRRTSSTRPARATRSPAASWATSPRTPTRRSTSRCCGARWPTGPCSRPSTSRRSAPSAC